MQKTENIVIAILAVAVIVLAYLNFSGGGVLSVRALSPNEAGSQVVAFINDYMLEGGQTAELVGDVVEENGLYKMNLSIDGETFASYVTRDGKILFPEEGVNIEDAKSQTPSNTDEQPEIVDVDYDENSHIRGDMSAPVTIIEFSDFQCPYCTRFHDTMKEVMAAYPTQVKLVYKHFPLDSIHPTAREAAEASECAGDQDKFWEYTDKLYENQSKISSSYLKELAVTLGLNKAQFDECLDNDKYADLVEKDYQDGISAGVRGTPGGFINGEVIGGAVPFSTLQSKIDKILSEEEVAPSAE